MMQPSILSASDDLLHVGVAFSAITPPVGFTISGPEFADRPARGVNDDIYVRCVALSSYGEIALIASLEIWGISASLRDRLVGAVSDVTGIPVDHVLITCTNNGTSPPLWRDADDLPEEYANYLRYIPDVVAGAALDATLALEPTAVGVSSTSVPGLNCFAESSPLDDNLEDEREKLRIVTFYNADQEVRCVLYTFACPATIVGETHIWTADYPGVASAMLEGTAIKVAIFMQGASSDVRPFDWWDGNPRKSHSARQPKDAQAFGILIATQVANALLNNTPRRNAQIKAIRDDDAGISVLRIGDLTLVSHDTLQPVEFSTNLQACLPDRELVVNTNRVTKPANRSDADSANRIAKCIEMAQQIS